MVIKPEIEKPGFLEKPGFWETDLIEKPGFLEKPGFWDTHKTLGDASLYVGFHEGPHNLQKLD